MKRINKEAIKILVWIVAILFLIILTTIILNYTNTPFPTICNIKVFGESISPIVEIVAIIVAGLWSYRLFIKNRTEYPFAEQEHKISHWNLENDTLYLSVIVSLKNSGNVLLELDSSKVFVQQVRPFLNELKEMMNNAEIKDIREGKVQGLFQTKGMQIAWRELGYRETSWERGEVIIEPGEREEFQFDFILDSKIQTVKVISYFRNVKIGRPELGWTKTSMYDLKGDSNE